MRILRKQVLKIWDLIGEFRERCIRSQGWHAYENDDLIEAENEYHKFFWVNHLYPSTFKSVVMNSLCAVRDGGSCKTVGLSHMAWVLPETPSPNIWQMFDDSPSLSRRVALYDLSRAYKGEPACLNLNETRSVVLREFERFLKAEYGIELTSFLKLRTSPNLEELPVQNAGRLLEQTRTR